MEKLNSENLSIFYITIYALLLLVFIIHVWYFVYMNYAVLWLAFYSVMSVLCYICSVGFILEREWLI